MSQDNYAESGFYPTERVKEAVKGHWVLVIAALAPEMEQALKKGGRGHVRCPMPHHDSNSKNFRFFKDVNETGGAICSPSCGSWKTGFNLLMDYHGWEFEECKNRIAEILGVEKVIPHSNKRDSSQAASRAAGQGHPTSAPALGELAAESPKPKTVPSTESMASAKENPIDESPQRIEQDEEQSAQRQSRAQAPGHPAAAPTTGRGVATALKPEADKSAAAPKKQAENAKPPAQSAGSKPKSMPARPGQSQAEPQRQCQGKVKAEDQKPTVADATRKNAAEVKPGKSCDAARPKPNATVTQLYKDKPWLMHVQAELEEQRKKDALYQAGLKERISRLWSNALPLTSPSARPAMRYLMSRKLTIRGLEVHHSLRFDPSLPYFDEDGNKLGDYPAILAAIRDPKGQLVTLHRTYLTKNGKKAVVPEVKKMMSVPADMEVMGGGIWLGEVTNGVLGVAEGLETALSVYRALQMPTWPLVSASILEGFEPPPGTKVIVDWADKDRSRAGEISANALSERMAPRGIKVIPLYPSVPIGRGQKGVDWNDVLITQGLYGFPRMDHLVAMIGGSYRAAV